jgi:acyl-CoA thioester hydrolase
MIEIGLGSVQTWECDAMGHLNVQFYVARAGDSLAGLALPLGIGPRYCRDHGVVLTPTQHHIRFHRELRPGAPFAFYGGVLGVVGDTLRLYQEMRHSRGGAVAATFLVDAKLLDVETRAPRRLPDWVEEKAAALRMAVPEHAEPKGISAAPPRPQASWREAERMGLVRGFEGALPAPECDRHGFMLPRAYIGKISDSIPNLLLHAREEADPQGRRIGGAALEYRVVYRSVPREGDLLALRAGLSGFTKKATSWVHWLIDRETGEAVATAESVGVRFDLDARRALEHPPATLQALEAGVVPGLTV